MKLMFTEANTSELQDLFGPIDRDFKISTIKTELYSAAKALVKLIGKEAYDYGISIYEKENHDDEDKFTIRCFQLPVFLDAYRTYAPSGDVSHTKNGRKMRNIEEEKSAFEWMINRDNEALEKRFYKSLDTLLEHLDDENPEFKAAAGEDPAVHWKDTDAYKNTHSTFVRTTSDYDEFFGINSRYLLVKLRPGVNQCEQNHVLPRLGQDKFDELKTALVNGGDVDQKLLNLVKGVCCYYSLAWGIPRLRVSLLPEGILQRYDGDRLNSKATKPSEKRESELVTQSFKEDYLSYLSKLENYLKPKPTPEQIQEANIIPPYSFDDDDQFASF